MRKKVVLKVHRYTQTHNFCAVATCAAIGNFYNPEVRFSKVKHMVPTKVSKEGMLTVEQALLLNELGVKSVSVVTADSYYFDFTWQKHTLAWKIKKLKRLITYYKRSATHDNGDLTLIQQYVKFLEAPECQNNLIIDWDFPKWIKGAIRRGNPVAASINWTAYFRMPKELECGDFDDIKGDTVDHAFVIRGFDDDYIYVVDSRGKRRKGYNGYYKIKWHHFLVNMGSAGELILVNEPI